jgi:hypothetical protein
LQVIGRDASSVLLAIGGPALAENFSQLYYHKRLTIWLIASTAEPSAWGVRWV